MSKLIALKSGAFEILNDALKSDFSKLKQEALLFDQIGILKLNHLYTTARETLSSFQKRLEPNHLGNVEAVFSELEWLRQKEIIYELTIQNEFQIQPTKGVTETLHPQKLKELTFLFNKIIEIQNSFSTKPKGNKAELNKEQHFAVLRLMAIFMELEKGVTAVTTFPHAEYIQALPNSNKSDVIQIVINNLPLPSNETPWEQIIDYRNDPENQNNLLGLRQWIRKISKEGLPKAEIEDEIEWRINEFQNHMKLHKMKVNTETLEVIVKTPLEMIENLIKLKFSKIPEPFFALKKRQINLMEAELNAPGREMAYIIKAKDTFQSSG